MFAELYSEEEEDTADSELGSLVTSEPQLRGKMVKKDARLEDDGEPACPDERKRKKKEWKIMLTAEMALQIYNLRPPLDQVAIVLIFVLL
jgi:hypothetical protein